VLRGWRFGTEAGEIDVLRKKLRSLCPDAEIWWISEPTGTRWMTVGYYVAGRGDPYFLVSNRKAHDLRRFWTRHVKNDVVDAETLARIELVAPEAVWPISRDPEMQKNSR